MILGGERLNCSSSTVRRKVKNLHLGEDHHWRQQARVYEATHRFPRAQSLLDPRPAWKREQLAGRCFTASASADHPPQHREIKANPEVDICLGEGADPWIVRDPRTGVYIMVQADDPNTSRYSGAKLLNYKCALSVEGLTLAKVHRFSFASLPPDYIGRTVWAPELHYIDGSWYMYVAMSNGDNNHQDSYVFRADNPVGSYDYLGSMSHDSSRTWYIDNTYSKTTGCHFFSYWKDIKAGFKQNIGVSLATDPSKYDKIIDLFEPNSFDTMNSGNLYEGPQEVVVGGKFLGIKFSDGRSWAEYGERIAWYIGNDGDYTNRANYYIDERPLIATGEGDGHGMFLEEPDGTLWYIRHKKTTSQYGWNDRKIYARRIDPQILLNRYAEVMTMQTPNDGIMRYVQPLPNAERYVLAKGQQVV